MSYLARTAVRSARLGYMSRRTFTQSSPIYKSATETVKEGLKTVDRAVSDKLVDSIEAGGRGIHEMDEIVR